MKTLEQIRAANALKSTPLIGKNTGGGDAISGFPALVVSNGLLATFAFSREKGGGLEAICNAIVEHLGDRGHLTGVKGTQAAIEYLSSQPSETLRLCTAETLAYLNYLKRFVKAATSKAHA